MNGDSIPARQSAPKKKSKTDRPLPDPRHNAVFQEIALCYEARNSLKVPWSSAHGKALNRLLASLPSWPVENLLHCVRSRFESEVNHSDDPIVWLHNLASYVGGRLDKFGKPAIKPLTEADGVYAAQYFVLKRKREANKHEFESVEQIAKRAASK